MPHQDTSPVAMSAMGADRFETEPDGITPRIVSRFRSGQLHRTVVLLAVVSLFIGTVTAFDTVIWTSPIAGVVMIVGYALALALAVMAFVVRRTGSLLALDIGVLVCTLMIRLPEFLTSLGTPQGRPNAPYATDEGALVANAANALLHGRNPYAIPWLGAHVPTQTGITATMSGGVIDHFDYPPMSALLAVVSRWLLPTQPAAAIVAFAGLLAATIVLFILLPAPWRSAGTMLCLGLGLYLQPLARQGYPEVLLLPFLVVAVNRWPRIGIDGRLRGLGLASAICLGLACATQQTAWFLVPFLVVGLLLVRVGDLGWRGATLLASRYVAVMLGAFAILNAPFVIWGPRLWVGAIVTPLGARTVPHGQGLIGLYNFLGGTSLLHVFSYAAAAFAIAALACLALFMRSLGPAMIMLPWPIFFLSVRSSDRYFYMLAPVWLISLATVRHRDFAKAWTPRIRPAWRPWVVAGLFLPSVLLVGAVIASPQPLKMNVLYVQPSKSSYTKEIFISVTNTSKRAIEPHFALASSVAMSRFWLASGGPKILEPGETAEYALLPPVPTARRSLLGPRIELRAVSAYPETISSVALPMLSASGVP